MATAEATAPKAKPASQTAPVDELAAARKDIGPVACALLDLLTGLALIAGELAQDELVFGSPNPFDPTEPDYLPAAEFVLSNVGALLALFNDMELRAKTLPRKVIKAKKPLRDWLKDADEPAAKALGVALEAHENRNYHGALEAGRGAFAALRGPRETRRCEVKSLLWQEFWNELARREAQLTKPKQRRGTQSDKDRVERRARRLLSREPGMLLKKLAPRLGKSEAWVSRYCDAWRIRHPYTIPAEALADAAGLAITSSPELLADNPELTEPPCEDAMGNDLGDGSITGLVGRLAMPQHELRADISTEKSLQPGFHDTFARDERHASGLRYDIALLDNGIKQWEAEEDGEVEPLPAHELLAPAEAEFLRQEAERQKELVRQRLIRNLTARQGLDARRTQCPTNGKPWLNPTPDDPPLKRFRSCFLKPS